MANNAMVALAALLALGVPPGEAEESVPVGMECTGCKGIERHDPKCRKPRGFRPLEVNA